MMVSGERMDKRWACLACQWQPCGPIIRQLYPYLAFFRHCWGQEDQIHDEGRPSDKVESATNSPEEPRKQGPEIAVGCDL